MPFEFYYIGGLNLLLLGLSTWGVIKTANPVDFALGVMLAFVSGVLLSIFALLQILALVSII